MSKSKSLKSSSATSARKPDGPNGKGGSRAPRDRTATQRTQAGKKRLPLYSGESAPRSRRSTSAASAAGSHKSKARPTSAASTNGEAALNGHAKPKATCTACGLCCSYVAIEIDSPTTVKRATQLLWYVYHEGVSLYANGDDWMVQFDSTCIHLQPDYRCGIYATRPHICREFSEKDCEVNSGDDGLTFYTAQEFLAHLKRFRPRVHAAVLKNFAPPDAPPRTRLAPFEQRFQGVVSRRQALGIAL